MMELGISRRFSHSINKSCIKFAQKATPKAWAVVRRSNNEATKRRTLAEMAG
jgi:hypothetical protein